MENKDKNIVFLVLDALRFDHVGGQPSLTPCLDQAADSGITFANAFTFAPFTPASTMAFLTGQYPNAHGQYSPLPEAACQTLLPQVLKNQGYRTYGISANPYISEYFGYARGWDEFMEMGSGAYRFLDRLSNLPFLGPFTGKLLPWIGKAYYTLQALLGWTGLVFIYPIGKKINKQIYKLLRSRGNHGKFFLYAHYMDNHTPYLDLLGKSGISMRRQAKLNRMLLSHGRQIKNLDKRDQADIKKLYQAEVEYIDRCLGELFAFFQRHGLYEKTLFIITSDHGEELFENGYHNHRGRLTDNLLRVPLFILDHKPERRTVKANVSLIHLPYTLTRLNSKTTPYTEKLNLLDPEKAEANQKVYYQVMRRRDNWMPFVGPFDPERHEKIYGLRFGPAHLAKGPDGRVETSIQDPELKTYLTELLDSYIRKSSRETASLKLIQKKQQTQTGQNT
jgi:arylsulfatase A-like enzyme